MLGTVRPDLRKRAWSLPNQPRYEMPVAFANYLAWVRYTRCPHLARTKGKAPE